MMSERLRRLLAPLLLAIALCCAMTACVGIPTSGGVEQGAVTEDEGLSNTGFLPDGPVAGSDQEAILAGFMNAAKGPQNNYQVAKMFLTEEFGTKWKPNASVLVRDGTASVIRQNENALDYRINTVAEVDADGRYIEVPPAPAQSLPFEFTQNPDGEWRISSAPNGVVLRSDDFDRVFSTQALYFFDPSYHYLIPDVRWFPTSGTVARSVVNALIAGQSEWLSQGVTVSAFPEGVELGNVQTTGSLVTVELSDGFLATPELEKQRFRLQLARSLGSVPNISAIQITVGGVVVSIPELGSVAADSNPTVDPRPVVLAEGQFGFDNSDAIEQIGQLSQKVVALEPAAASLAPSGIVAAVLAADGTVYSARTGDAAPVAVDKRPGLVAPSIDGAGFIWSVPGSAPAELSVFEADGTAHPVASTLPAEVTVTSMNVSRDGARILFSLVTPAGPRLLAAGIIRDGDVPIAIGVPYEIPIDSGSVQDATWVDARSVATISGSGAESEVTVYVIGGRATSLPSLEGAVSIVGGNGGERGLRILDTAGAVLVKRGSSWQETGISASLLATQQ